MKKIILFVMIFMFSLTLYGCDFGNPNKRFIDFTTNGKYAETDIVIVNAETFQQAYDLYKGDNILFYILSETHDLTEVLKITGVNHNLNQLYLKNPEYSLLGYFWMNGSNNVLPHYVSKSYADKSLKTKDRLMNDIEKYYELIEVDLLREVQNRQNDNLSSVQECLLSNELFSHYIAIADTKNPNNQIIDHGLEIIGVVISNRDTFESLDLQVKLIDTNVHDYYDKFDFNSIKYDSLTSTKILGGIGTKNLNVQYQTGEKQDELMKTYLYIKAYDDEYGELKSVNFNWKYNLLHKYEVEPVEVVFEVK